MDIERQDTECRGGSATFCTMMLVGASVAGLLTASAYARPVDGGLGLLEPASRMAEEVIFFHDIVLMPIITAICLFVLALLVYIVVKYNQKANPTPARFSHNMTLEIIWSTLPIAILGYIAAFSFEILAKQDTIPDGKILTVPGGTAQTVFTLANDFPKDRKLTQSDHVQVFTESSARDARTQLRKGRDYTLSGLKTDSVIITLKKPVPAGQMLEILGGRSRTGVGKFLDLFGTDRSEIVTAPTLTIKVTGYQWGWSYTYPEYKGFEYSSHLAKKADLADPSLYLLQATENVVVPVGETVRVLTTSRDVIHSWALPNFTLKIDAVPGRINETWFKAPEKPGMFYGQCSEICGKDHAYMPITLEVKTRTDFESWVNTKLLDDGSEPFFTQANTQATNATLPRLAAHNAPNQQAKE